MSDSDNQALIGHYFLVFHTYKQELDIVQLSVSDHHRGRVQDEEKYDNAPMPIVYCILLRRGYFSAIKGVAGGGVMVRV